MPQQNATPVAKSPNPKNVNGKSRWISVRVPTELVTWIEEQRGNMPRAQIVIAALELARGFAR